jgi:hypothetical protein
MKRFQFQASAVFLSLICFNFLFYYEKQGAAPINILTYEVDFIACIIHFISISRLHTQTGFGGHPTCYSMTTGRYFPWVKQLMHLDDHSPTCTAKADHVWSLTYTRLCTCITCC